MRRLILALLIVSAPLAAQTFPTTTALPAALPDGTGSCVYGAPINCVVPVTGVSGATSVSINFTFAPAHTWYGDVHCAITSPSGATVLALAASCDGSLDDSSDLGGPYTVSDGAPSFDAAAAAAGAVVIAAGTYGGDNPMNVLLACGANANGNWTVTFQDVFASDTGTLAACSLTFGAGGGGDSFTICQAGPFQPVNLIHTGTPGATYINPALANTPAAVPNGWAFGLDIPYPVFINEVTMAPPLGDIFHGTIGAGGTSVVVVPGVPSGWTIQIAGVHFDPVSGLPVYGSGGINYTVL